MMKRLYDLLLISTVSLLAACRGEAELQVQQPDGQDKVRLEIRGTQEIATRASSEYRPWDKETDPSSMGVFGYYDMQSSGNTIFNNAKFIPVDNTNAWNPEDASNQKRWTDEGIASATQFAFFAYMPFPGLATSEAEGVKLEKETKTDTLSYTLSIPFLIDNVFLSESENTTTKNIHQSMPLICKEPGTKPSTGKIQMQFDQTLAGFQIAFKLGQKMENVRDITIKKVRIYGEDLPYKGLVSRSYTLSAGGSWSIGDITWTFDTENPTLYTKTLSKKTPAPDGEFAAFEMTHTNAETSNLLQINSTEFQQWGSTIYALPAKASDFKPTIEVTYDVKTNDSEGSVLTRKDVVSTIELNTTNFKNYKGGECDVITKLDILIVPSYLYVLADADQHAGQIVIP